MPAPGHDKSNAPDVNFLLRWAVEKLREAGVETPLLDAEVILSHACGCSRTYLIAHPDFQPSLEVTEHFSRWVERRSRREPLAYIVGEREFYGISFEVTPAVLVPRPETEVLVETALRILRDIPNAVILDIGVGSGAIAVSIAKSAPEVTVYGTELSAAALEVARRNAERTRVQDRVRLFQGDLFEPVAGMRFDLIASNPPYIPSSEIERLEPEVSKYEPRQALDGGPDGLDYYRRISVAAREYLKPAGILAVEIGMGQSGAVEGLFEENGFANVRAISDYSGIERVVLGENA